MRGNRRRIVIAGVSILVVAGAFAAYALWAGSGTGSGRARATTAVEATINPVDCAAQPGCIDLYPGYADGDVYFTITNPNPYDITFTDMTPGAITVIPAACPAGSITVAPTTGLALVAPANATTGELSVLDVVTMSIDAPNECQGAAYDIALTLTGEQTP
jgi:hypothetical protein